MYPCICDHPLFQTETGLLVHWGIHHAHLPVVMQQSQIRKARAFHQAWLRENPPRLVGSRVAKQRQILR